MRRAGLLLALCAACTDYNALVDQCVAEGRCPAEGAGGGSGGGSAGSSLLATDAGDLDFSLPLTDSSTTRITLRNDGTASSQSIVIEAEGAAAAEFTVNGAACNAGLSPGQSCPVDVTFHPAGSDAGVRDAQLVAQPGSGTKLSLLLHGVATPAFDAPALVDFGPVTSGDHATKTITLKNLTSASHSLGRSVSGPFVPMNDHCSLGMILSGDSCTVDVEYDADAGVETGTLRYAVDQTTTSFNIALTGTGAVPGVLQISPDPIFDGGLVDVGAIIDHAFTVKNSGAQPLTVALSTLGDQGDAFHLVDAGCGMLGPGASCDGVLRFAPTAVQAYSSRLVASAGAFGINTAHAASAGQRNVTLSVAVSPVDAGTVVFSVGDGGAVSCHGQCQLSRLVTPSDLPIASARAVRSTFIDFGGWSGACAGDAGCSVLLDGANANVALNASFVRVNRVFITLSSTNGNLGGRDGGDAICQQTAATHGLPGTWLAYLSVVGSPAGSRLPATGGWVRTDGMPFALSRDALQRGDVITTLSTDWSGGSTRFSALDAFTGTEADGGVGPNCLDWTTADQNYSGEFGASYASTRYWTQGINTYAGGSCISQASLYCFETDGTGSPQPPARDAGVVFFVATAPNPHLDGGTAAAFAFFDGECAQRAAAFGLDGGAKALISGDSTTAARPGVYPASAAPIYRPDGVYVGQSDQVQPASSSVYVEPPNVRISPTGALDYVAGPIATGWTAGTCVNWSSASTGLQTYCGYPSRTEAAWQDASAMCSCATLVGSQLSFYCLTAPQ